MKIAILGTRGIPNRYGGFEQLAEHLSVDLYQRGHQVFVYQSSQHPYKENEFKGAQLLHCYDPENILGTFGQFIYDFNCIRDSRNRNFDVILQLGYTSSSVWSFLLPKKSKIITNMDGLEWKRSKYSKSVKHFLKYAESLAVRSSDTLVSDSLGIKDYLMNKYKVDSTFIAYGAFPFENPNEDSISVLKLEKNRYALAIARMEPENNMETIIKGYIKSKNEDPLLLIGNVATTYGNGLFRKYHSDQIRFAGAIYDQDLLNNLRYYSNIYFHGHTVGGTNPSLLEAMASGAFICANKNPFNEAVLGADALYFSDENDIARHIQGGIETSQREIFISANLKKITAQYSWEHISSAYELLMKESLK